MNERSHPYRSLGGWLAFTTVGMIIGVVVVVCVLLYNLYQLFSNIKYLSGAFIFYDLLVVGMAIVPVVFFWTSSREIREKDWLFLRSYENAMIWLIVYELVIRVFEAFLFKINLFSLIFNAENLSRIVSPIIALIIWGNYFSRSVRVRTYFCTDKYVRVSRFFNGYAPSPAIPDPGSEEYNNVSHLSGVNGSDSNTHLSSNTYSTGTAKPGSEYSYRARERGAKPSDWQCYCGRVNSIVVGTCACGRTRDWNKEYMEKKLAEEHGVVNTDKNEQDSIKTKDIQSEEKTANKPDDKKEVSVEKEGTVDNKRIKTREEELQDIKLLAEYKKLLDMGAISKEEYEIKKADMMG